VVEQALRAVMSMPMEIKRTGREQDRVGAGRVPDKSGRYTNILCAMDQGGVRMISGQWSRCERKKVRTALQNAWGCST
jgi:hypothetical protein